MLAFFKGRVINAQGNFMNGNSAVSKSLFILFCIVGGAHLTGCVVYEPLPPGYVIGSAFDRAWSAALNGALDAGIQIVSNDPPTGLIRGMKDGIAVTIVVARQPDGSARVQFDASGPTQRDPGLADRFSQAYDRHMGR